MLTKSRHSQAHPDSPTFHQISAREVKKSSLFLRARYYTGDLIRGAGACCWMPSPISYHFHVPSFNASRSGEIEISRLGLVSMSYSWFSSSPLPRHGQFCAGMEVRP